MKIFIDAPLLIYLNTVTDPRNRILYENFYIDILTRYKPYTDALVFDELIYVSKKRYGIPYNISIEFIESSVLPYVHVISLGEEEYREAIKFILEYGIKPSDALHLGAMINNEISLIVSEDKDFDKISLIKKVWL